MNTGFWSGQLMKGDHLEDLGAGGRITLQWFLKNWDGEAWTGLLWLTIEKGGRQL